MSLHGFEENECILTTQRHCPCIEFHPTSEERYGFHASQLLHYRLETEETVGHPPHKLTLGFGTADVILTGWRLDRVTAHVRDGDLLAVRTSPIRYADISRAKPHVATIMVTPIAKE
jgi:hypothetical protein